MATVWSDTARSWGAAGSLPRGCSRVRRTKGGENKCMGKGYTHTQRPTQPAQKTYVSVCIYVCVVVICKYITSVHDFATTHLLTVTVTVWNGWILLPTNLYEYSDIPCAILLCGSDNTVVDRHGPLDRLADWHHHLLLVLLLHHLLIFISHWNLENPVRRLVKYYEPIVVAKEKIISNIILHN